MNNAFWDGFVKHAGLVEKAVGSTLNYKQLMKEFVAKNKGAARGMPMKPAVAGGAAPLGAAAAKVTAAAPKAIPAKPLSPIGQAATATTTKTPYTRIGDKTWVNR